MILKIEEGGIVCNYSSGEVQISKSQEGIVFVYVVDCTAYYE